MKKYVTLTYEKIFFYLYTSHFVIDTFSLDFR